MNALVLLALVASASAVAITAAPGVFFNRPSGTAVPISTDPNGPLLTLGSLYRVDCTWTAGGTLNADTIVTLGEGNFPRTPVLAIPTNTMVPSDFTGGNEQFYAGANNQPAFPAFPAGGATVSYDFVAGGAAGGQCFTVLPQSFEGRAAISGGSQTDTVGPCSFRFRVSAETCSTE